MRNTIRLALALALAGVVVSGAFSTGSSPAEGGESAIESAPVVGNVRSKILHRTACSHVPSMTPSNRRVYLLAETALADGYRWCRICGPGSATATR